MEEINASPKAYDGLLRIGYVANLRNGAYIKELQDVLNGTDQEPTSQESVIGPIQQKSSP